MTGAETRDNAVALARPAEARTTPLGAFGLVSLMGILWWLSGVAALGVAVPVGAIWYATSAPYAVAAAHVGLVVLVPGVSPAALVAFEVSALAVLLGDAPETTDGIPLPLALMGTVTTASLAAIAYGGLAASGELWVAVTCLVAAFGLGAYGLHRYGVVQRQLREGSDES